MPGRAPLLTASAFVGALVAAPPPPLSAQVVEAPQVTETVFDLGGGEAMRYAISLPEGYRDSPREPRPLILALHPGGRSPYYGSWFMQAIVDPALRGWGAVIVAPDVPDERWATERSERALLALLDDVFDRHVIDRTRVLVTGFSMGGRGTWYMVTRHADLFTGAIVMATGPGDGALESLSSTPLYIIHSPDDEVVPYAPVEELALLLSGRGYPVQMMRLPGANHSMMGDYVAPLRVAGQWMWKEWDARGARDR